MSLTFEQIPDHDQPPPGAKNTTALKNLNVPGGRRTVLRAMALGAMTVGATALNWSGTFGNRKAAAETGPYALQGWDRNDCHDAYPHGYDEEGDTSGQYVTTYAACVGGTWRGSNYCDAGWHKYGTWNENGVQADHVPISTACGVANAKNAWRWTTPNGQLYRCSDGHSTFWGRGYIGQTYLTICRAQI